METRIDPVLTNAFESVRLELLAMRPEDIEQIRYDITASIVTALGVRTKLRDVRPEIVSRLGEAAGRFIDRLETDANACSYANARHLPTLHGKDLEEIAGRLSRTRGVLLLEAQALVARGIVSGSALAELVGGTSYRGLYLDVVQLVAVFRSHWAAAQAQTGITATELDEAEALAAEFSSSLGETEQGSLSSPTADIRRRAYTRFVRTYSEIRRQVTLLHWERGDADDIIPPLGAGRSRSNDEPAGVLMPPVTPVPATNGARPQPALGMPGAPAFGPTS